MSKVIVHLNASALKSDLVCGRRWFLHCQEGWTGTRKYNDTEYGTAFHKFVAKYREMPEEPDFAVAAAIKHYKSQNWTVRDGKAYLTISHLASTCHDYANFYSKDEFQTLKHKGKPLTEVKFAIPYYVDDHVEIILEGTIDDLCKNSRGCFCIRDYKTTASRDAETYLNGYRLSTQLYTYCKAIRWYAEAYPNSIIAEFASTKFGCFIDGIFLRGNSSPVDFIRSDIFYFSESAMAEFEELLQATCRRISSYIQAAKRPAREGLINGACFTGFACPFFGACVHGDERYADAFLKQHMKQVAYEPLRVGLEE